MHTLEISDGRTLEAVHDGRAETIISIVQPNGERVMVCSMHGPADAGIREAQRIAAGLEFELGRLAPQQVLEVLYVAAGSNRTRAEYFPAGELGEEEYRVWLSWPSRVNDPAFYVWTVTEVLVGRAYDPAAAVRTYERGRRLHRPAGAR